MNRNTELHFSHVPAIDLKRSKFEMSHSHKTTFNVGDVIPLMVDADILPGDTVNMDMASLVRMATPIYPIMDNLFLDTYWFFVPNRLLWDHWQAFWGENDDPWTQSTEYEIPQITAPNGGWTEGTIADYMGIPTKVGNISVNALPFRAYAKIWNDWFRDENIKTNCHIYTDETTRTGQNGTESGYSYVTGVELGGKPAKAAKMHDYFTSVLPEPQKGPEVKIPTLGNAHVYGTTDEWLLTNADRPTNLQGIKFRKINTNTGNFDQLQNKRNLVLGTSFGNQLEAETATYTNASELIFPTNLYADLGSATTASINALRTAFAIQKYYENAARGGTRYIEYIRSVFGVTSSDARMQRAEYLGGKRIPINIDQILQTSSTDQTSPQGNTAGFSCTIDKHSAFTKSFEEHGVLMCLGVIRTEHTYQQGLAPMWQRKKWHSFFNPFFANLGEMGVPNKTIYAQGTNKDDEIFGYQEAWAEYRYKNSYVTGYMRSNATGSLDVWHFADDYNSLPLYSSDWIDEPYANVDRTIAVSSQLTHQFIADFFFKCFYTRPMPVYSVPGLIDHV